MNGIVTQNDFDLEISELEFAESCMLWLSNEGLIRWTNTAHTLNDLVWIDPVLSARGFAFLGTQFDFDGKQVSLAEAVIAGEKVNGNLAVIGDFLGGALGGFTKSLGS